MVGFSGGGGFHHRFDGTVRVDDLNLLYLNGIARQLDSGDPGIPSIAVGVFGSVLSKPAIRRVEGIRPVLKPVLHDPLGQFQLSGIVQTIVKTKVPSLSHINIGFMTISPGQLALDHMVFFVPCDKCHAAFGNIGEGKGTAAQIIHHNVLSFRSQPVFQICLVIRPLLLQVVPGVLVDALDCDIQPVLGAGSEQRHGAEPQHRKGQHERHGDPPPEPVCTQFLHGITPPPIGIRSCRQF